MSIVLSTCASRFKAFLACPISGYLTDGELPPAYERFIRALYAVLQERCDEVFLALEREDWGRNLMLPATCTPLDYVELQRSDLVVAYPGTSCGVAVELGWASALGKPLILILEEGAEYSPLIEGLADVSRAPCELIRIAARPRVDDLDAVTAALEQALRRLRRRLRDEAGEPDSAELAGDREPPADAAESATAL